MKRTLLTWSLALGAAALPTMAATVPFPDVEAAKQQAKAERKPALILWYGSDWTYGVEAFCADWQKQAGISPEVVFGQFDEHTGLPENVRKKTLPIEHYNLPVLVLLAPDGSFMAGFSGKQAYDPAGVMKQIRPLVGRSSEFVSLAEKARSAPGTEGAEAAGKALSLLPVKEAMMNRELTGIINRKDPDDVTGYRALFCMDHIAMYREINKILQGGADGNLKGADRDFTSAEQYVRRVLERKNLTGERLQQWLSGLAFLRKERMLLVPPAQRDALPLLETLDAIVRINPDSQYGKGAAKLRHYWDPHSYTVIRDGFYNSGDQSYGFEKAWHVDVTSSVDGSGTYVFSLIPCDNGAMVTRHYRLVIDGKEVSTGSSAPDVNTKTTEFQVPDVPKGAKVEVWLTAQCNDVWFGCQGFVEMKKKGE